MAPALAASTAWKHGVVISQPQGLKSLPTITVPKAGHEDEQPWLAGGGNCPKSQSQDFRFLCTSAVLTSRPFKEPLMPNIHLKSTQWKAVEKLVTDFGLTVTWSLKFALVILVSCAVTVLFTFFTVMLADGIITLVAGSLAD